MGALHSQPSYVSADSAPTGFAVVRGRLLAPAFLVLFTLASAAVASWWRPLTTLYGHVLSATSGAPLGRVLAPGASVSVRPLFLLFLVLLALSAAGPLRGRLRFLAAAVSAYLVATLVVDTALMDNRVGGLPTPLSARGGIAAVLTGLAVIALLILTQYRMPAEVRICARRRRLAMIGLFVGLVALTAWLVVVSAAVRNSIHMDVPLVNGFSSNVVFFLICAQVLLFLIGLVSQRARPSDDPALSVAFLIPAHNEGAAIGRVIEALDAAALRYAGRSRVVVVNNRSTDATVERARAALERCLALTGEVVDCDIAGKGYALNFGLGRIDEEIVIRVDGDTLVEPTLLTKVIAHFGEPWTGGVSGLPLPREDAPRWLFPVRLMEALYSVAFLRAGQAAVDGVLVMPGNMAAYRRELLEELGGFGVGFNGEDTDVAVRIGRLGYRIVTDLRIRFYPEVPATLAHLREQRQRWSRGTFYVTARNRSAIGGAQGARGLFTLPWAFANACRRAVMLPLLVAVGTAGLVAPGLITLRQVAVIGGLLLGIHLATVIVLLMANRSFRAILWIPVYFLFRVFKLYVAFEALLTLELRNAPRHRLAASDHAPGLFRLREAPGTR